MSSVEESTVTPASPRRCWEFMRGRCRRGPFCKFVHEDSPFEANMSRLSPESQRRSNDPRPQKVLGNTLQTRTHFAGSRVHHNDHSQVSVQEARVGERLQSHVRQESNEPLLPPGLGLDNVREPPLSSETHKHSDFIFVDGACYADPDARVAR